MNKQDLTPMPGAERLNELMEMTMRDLLDTYENAVIDLVQAANGLNRMSEKKCGERVQRLREEILKIIIQH